MDNIENLGKISSNNPVVGLLQEIEADILALLKENARLKERIAELSKVQSSTTANQKIIILEEELRKLKKTVTELQSQEDNSRERINQLRKIIQEEINAPQSKSSSEDFGPTVTKSAVTQSSPPVDESAESGVGQPEPIDEGQVGYSPYISEDVSKKAEDEAPKDPIGYDFFEDDVTQGPSTENEEVPEYKEFAPDAPKELIEKSIPQNPKSVTRGPGGRSKIPIEENPNAFLISESDEEEDPFAEGNREGDGQMGDDDFFKLSSQK